MVSGPSPAPTYRALFAIPGLRPLAGNFLLGRMGEAMWSLALILFVLQRFHSPALAGLVTFLAWMPGLLLSPLGGVLIDRFGRVRMIALDLGVAVLCALAIAVLTATGSLTVANLLTVVGVSSITGPLAWVGTRSLIPLVVPSQLWERGNALDAVTANVATIAGPALAGLLFATVGGLATLLVIAAVWIVAGLFVLGLRDVAPGDLPSAPSASGNVLRDAAGALRYVLGNRILWALAVLLPLCNAAEGGFQVALPVLFRSFPYGGSAITGAVWSLFGVAAAAGALAGGRMATAGRERRIISQTLAACALAYGVVATAALLTSQTQPLLPLLPVAVGMLAAGLCVGVHDIAMFSLRQRSIDPGWLGRAMSVSMSLNAVGLPVGTALAGPIVQASLPLAMLLAAGLVGVAALLCPLLLPPAVRTRA
jgi:MFS family permease